jgi:hypothetical protein
LQQWRINSRGLSKLTSIPEVTEQQLEDLKRPASYVAAFVDGSSSLSSSSSQQMSPWDMDDVPLLQQEQQLHVQSDAEQQNAGPHLGSSTSSTSSEAHSRNISASDGAGGDFSNALNDDTSAAEATTAAAATWVTNVRHFTDCVPISPDSVCSSSTYCSLMVGVKDSSNSSDTAAHHHHQQQQQQQHQIVHSAGLRRQQQYKSSTLAGLPIKSPCSITNSCSSTSLVPTNDSAAAAAVGEAAVHASLLQALHDLDELEFLPFDRVAQWLEAQAAAAASTSSSSNILASTSDDDDSSDHHQHHHQHQHQAVGSSSDAVAAPPQQHQQQQGEEALFDAPDWWQEAVLARLQQQREAFQGSWWSRARVLAALAAQKAACALQI